MPVSAGLPAGLDDGVVGYCSRKCDAHYDHHNYRRHESAVAAAEEGAQVDSSGGGVLFEKQGCDEESGDDENMSTPMKPAPPIAGMRWKTMTNSAPTARRPSSPRIRVEPGVDSTVGMRGMVTIVGTLNFARLLRTGQVIISAGQIACCWGRQACRRLLFVDSDVLSSARCAVTAA